MMANGDDDIPLNWNPAVSDPLWVERMVTADKLSYLRHETFTAHPIKVRHGKTCPCKVCGLNRALNKLFPKDSKARAHNK